MPLVLHEADSMHQTGSEPIWKDSIRRPHFGRAPLPVALLATCSISRRLLYSRLDASAFLTQRGWVTSVLRTRRLARIV